MGLMYQIVVTLLSFLEFAMFARAILSWFRKLTEPFQRGNMIPIDFAFLLAFIMLGVLRQLLAYGLY